jgi:hypothetical protein
MSALPLKADILRKNRQRPRCATSRLMQRNKIFRFVSSTLNGSRSLPSGGHWEARGLGAASPKVCHCDTVDELGQHVAARPIAEGVDVQCQKHSQGPKQVLGVPPLQAICEE